MPNLVSVSNLRTETQRQKDSNGPFRSQAAPGFLVLAWLEFSQEASTRLQTPHLRQTAELNCFRNHFPPNSEEKYLFVCFSSQCVALAALEFITEIKVALNFRRSAFLCLLSTGIKNMCHYACSKNSLISSVIDQVSQSLKAGKPVQDSLYCLSRLAEAVSGFSLSHRSQRSHTRWL